MISKLEFKAISGGVTDNDGEFLASLTKTFNIEWDDKLKAAVDSSLGNIVFEVSAGNVEKLYKLVSKPAAVWDIVLKLEPKNSEKIKLGKLRVVLKFSKFGELMDDDKKICFIRTNVYKTA
jgi:hypothetical protein